MIIEDFWGEQTVDSVDAIHVMMKRRTRNGCNEVAMYCEGDYPQLRILLKDSVACVHYFSDEDDCGRYAYDASSHRVKTTDLIEFEISLDGEIVEVSDGLIVNESIATEIAQFFFYNQTKSSIVCWYEL